MQNKCDIIYEINIIYLINYLINKIKFILFMNMHYLIIPKLIY